MTERQISKGFTYKSVSGPYHIVRGGDHLDLVKVIAGLQRAISLRVMYELGVDAAVSSSCACGPVAVCAEAAEEI